MIYFLNLNPVFSCFYYKGSRSLLNFLGSIATKDDPQYFRLMMGDKKPFETWTISNGWKTNIYIDLQNANEFNNSIFQQLVNVDILIWEKCGMKIRYELKNQNDEIINRPIEEIRDLLKEFVENGKRKQ